MLAHTFAALSALSVASAHFQLNFPVARGFVDDTEGTFPCGGFDSVQQQRTNFPIQGGPIQLNMGHQQTNVAVYMAIGANPGSGFSIVAKQQLTVEVLGDFCLGSVGVPAGLNVSDGTPASIQVVTNDHAGGGLYQCADVTLVNTQLSADDFSKNCKNATNLRVSQENIPGNPNGTSTEDHSSHSASPTASSTARPAASSTGAAPQVKIVSWGLGAVGLVGMVML
ncbi:hypothetical protein BKA66DRAFT_524762 [Pyrenochaeta sp. MPI-SDFR-AT-0127]|nr:hypothetical protein BKA66DRAFT_524762 [Pyrenochaeta sp. MPI-SDFR-AT-0127]